MPGVESAVVVLFAVSLFLGYDGVLCFVLCDEELTAVHLMDDADCLPMPR